MPTLIMHDLSDGQSRSSAAACALASVTVHALEAERSMIIDIEKLYGLPKGLGSSTVMKSVMGRSRSVTVLGSTAFAARAAASGVCVAQPSVRY